MRREEEKQIYNYCMRLWDELKEKDNGYYPSKHDPVVLSEASNKFNIPEEEVNAIFQKVSSVISAKEIKGMSKEEKLKELTRIAENNQETPWGKKE